MGRTKEKLNKMDKGIRSFIDKNIRRKDNLDKREIKLVGFRLFEVVILISMATIIGVFSGSFFTYSTLNGNDIKDKSTSTYMNEFEEAFDNVIDNYYEKVDKDKLIDAAINGMLSTLDGYTSYMNEEEKEQFDERMNGEYQGIGIEFTTAPGYVHTVTDVFEGSPAYIAGIKKDDIIVSLDDIDASKKLGTEIASYIKEKATPDIKVVVKRNGENITLNITKKTVELPSVTKKIFEKNGRKVGYLSISLFADNTYNQFKRELTTLEGEGISSLIIDVRNNSGGYLHAADDILELFLSKGDILYKMEGQSGTVEYKDGTEEKRTYPISILINGESASASEILAAAMNEVYDSDLVGTTSFGKGTVQQPSDLSNGGMIKVTTNKWLTPKGNWVNKAGLEPTISVEMGDVYKTTPTDENDTQLQKALEVIAK